jgi:hypothetical protein
MPFSGCFARVFNMTSVCREAPACSGVFGLSDSREWIYVGETDNIQNRLLELLNDVSTSGFLEGRMPTGYSFEICSPDGRVARQDRLVQELDPTVNRRPLKYRR